MKDNAANIAAACFLRLSRNFIVAFPKFLEPNMHFYTELDSDVRDAFIGPN